MNLTGKRFFSKNTSFQRRSTLSNLSFQGLIYFAMTSENLLFVLVRQKQSRHRFMNVLVERCRWDQSNLFILRKKNLSATSKSVHKSSLEKNYGSEMALAASNWIEIVKNQFFQLRRTLVSFVRFPSWIIRHDWFQPD